MRTPIVATVTLCMVAACSSERAATVPLGLAGAADTLTTETRQILSTIENLRRVSPALADSATAVLRLEMQMGLARLGFGTRFTAEDDQPTRSAVKEFETIRGLPVTGDMFAPPTLDRLRRDMTEAWEHLIYPPPKSLAFSSWDQGYVTADGGWRGVDTDLSPKLQAVKISCWREQGMCRVEYAKLGAGEMLSLDDEVYRLTEWGRERIRGVQDDPCARYELEISRSDSTVRVTRATRSMSAQCLHMDRGPVHLELFDGLTEQVKAPDWRRLQVLGPRARAMLLRQGAQARP